MKEHKDILTAVRRGFFEWIAYGYRVLEWSACDYGGSKKLCYTLAWEEMMPYSIYQKEWVREQGMTSSGFEIWTVGQLECVFDYKYKNKSTIAA